MPTSRIATGTSPNFWTISLATAPAQNFEQAGLYRWLRDLALNLFCLPRRMCSVTSASAFLRRRLPIQHFGR